MSLLTENAVADLHDQLRALLPTGRSFAVRGCELAAEIGISERMVRALVEDLIDDGWLVGSRCSGDHPGYFLIVDLKDLSVGTAHLRSRALSMLHRYRTVQRNAQARFGDDALTLFDLEEVART